MDLGNTTQLTRLISERWVLCSCVLDEVVGADGAWDLNGIPALLDAFVLASDASLERVVPTAHGAVSELGLSPVGLLFGLSGLLIIALLRRRGER